MRITVLTDNIAYEDFAAEWGLSILIEYDGRKYLLDTGASRLFADNAALLGIDLADVDFSTLSHAHWDHANGFDTFLRSTVKPDSTCGPEQKKTATAPKTRLRRKTLQGSRLSVREITSTSASAPAIWSVSATGSSMSKETTSWLPASG